MKYLYYLTLLFFVLTNCNTIEPDFTPSKSAYFPLSLGNTWTYTTSLENQITYSIFNKKVINNLTYYTYGIQNTSDTALLRSDSLGRIFIRKNNSDFLYYDFSKKDSSIYGFKAYCQRLDLADSFTVFVKNNTISNTSMGTNVNCMDLYFDIKWFKINDSTYSDVIDEEYGLVFAPNIGIVSKYGCMVGGLTLVSYTLNN